MVACRLPWESWCCASAALRGHRSFTFTLPGVPLELGLPFTPYLPWYLEFLPPWHTNLVPTSGTSQLLFPVWKCSSLMNLHECFYLLSERSAQMGLQRCFPWSPQIKDPRPPHLPHHRSFRSWCIVCLLICLPLPLPPTEYKFCWTYGSCLPCLPPLEPGISEASQTVAYDIGHKNLPLWAETGDNTCTACLTEQMRDWSQCTEDTSVSPKLVICLLRVHIFGNSNTIYPIT